MPGTSRDRDKRGRRRDEGYDEDEAYEDRDAPQPPPGQQLSATVAAQAGLRHIAELSGKPPTGVTSLERGEDGWVVGVEVVEDRRIPSSADILGIYQVEVDMDGELVAYRRTRRYPRGRSDRGESR